MENIDKENFDEEALIRQNFPRQTFAPYGMLQVHISWCML